MTAPRVSALTSCYRGERYLPAFLENCARQTIASRTEVVLVHNDPSETELELVREFDAAHPGLITHVVVPREPLAVSTNRALEMAHGDYVCVWNIDDLRTPDSLELMARTLDEHPKAGFTYGDFMLVRRPGETSGQLVEAPEFDAREFARSMHAGPFYMWRRSLCAQVGYWDEQMRMGADLDYAIRLALAAQGRKTHGLLGYYLDEGAGLSTGRTPWQPIERTMLELRYGAYDKVELPYVRAAKRYRIDALQKDGRWLPLDHAASDHRRFARSRLWLALGVLRLPLALLRRLAKALR